MLKEKVNILLVDDRPEGIYTLERVLANENYNLVKASSGPEALKRVLDTDFALILLDVQMPLMDGFETASLIRERKRSRHVPIIFVTAISKDEQYVGKGYKSGAVDYLFKPINPEVLKSKVSVFVELHIKNLKIKEQELELRQKQLAEQKYENLLRYESLANSIPHMIWRTSLAGELEYFNQKWFEYTGVDQNNYKEDYFSLIHLDDLDVVKEKWTLALENNEIDTFHFECRLRNNKTNRYNWFKNLVIAEKNKSGEKISWLGTSTDINEMKELEKKKASFLSIASHELRTPLTAIKSSMELATMLLQQDELDKKSLEEVLTVGNDSSDQVNELLDEFLDFSRVESGRLSIRPQRTNLSMIVNKAIESHAPKIKSLGRLQVETKISENVCGDFDGPRIRQVIDNLISNAIKYTPDKGTIKVSLDALNEKIILSVADEGVGIEQENINKIFQPFKRVNEDEHVTGLGIGLYISSWIVKEHHGLIEVKSSPGLGSEFIVKFPNHFVQGSL